MYEETWFWIDDLDLSAKSYEEFVDFFFAREVVADDDQYDYFLRDLDGKQYEEISFKSPEVVVGYMTRMFTDFGPIASPRSLALVDQAVWAILGMNLKMYDLLWDEKVALQDRLRCIQSMYDVFANFVASLPPESEESGFFMWWDLLLHAFWLQEKFLKFRRETARSEVLVKEGEVGKLDADSRSVLDAMFETLVRILELPSRKCQFAALHGFNHLHHPAGPPVVQDFIDRLSAEFSAEDRKWMQDCRDGVAR